MNLVRNEIQHGVLIGCAGNRDARYAVTFAGAWEGPAGDEANIGWARQAWADIRPLSTGGTYINFLTQDEGADRTKDALGKALNRLRRIKAKWDPDNFFRTNRNILPAL